MAKTSSILMEELSSELKFRRVSFATQHRLPSYSSGRLEKMNPYGGALEHWNKEKPSSSSCNHSLEVPKSPYEAMEFLSRSWSPSASDFFQIFSTDSLSLPLHENDNMVEEQRHDEIEEMRRTTKPSAQSNKDRVESIWKWLAAGRTFSVLQRHTSLKKIWMNIQYMKGWLRGHSLRSLAKGRHWHKQVEEIRLETAKIHAALSVAELAAAVAGFATKGGGFDQLEEINGIMGSDDGGGCWNQRMGVVFASAAALVATVCAEAAESAGAHRAHVAAAVNSGLAITSSSDMITLTATAATCLRGAATLKSRLKADTYFSKDLEMLAKGTQLSMCTPSGDIKLRMLCIYLKHNRLVLRSRKKYLGGFLTSSKEYKIINVIKETKEAQGLHPIRLLTNVGKIVLLFEDEKQCNIWKSTISHLLQNQSSYSAITDVATRRDA
ncbi:VAN3-binding protein-like [Macadamia integrifolia]|uniref:VAN3-binding protein-like n=1 Tax=Macadamia integrifolia TaxID=60698 RepID=UPI001C4FD790|nr:VAN3-binding protein-like [Macadamia integrifolia]